MMKIDAHQHFWVFDSTRNIWITEDMAIIRHSFLPDDLKPILDHNNFFGCVAVQADQSEEETQFLLDLAASNDFIKGIVGWVDLRSNDLVTRLDSYSMYPKFKGVRHILQDEADGFMLESAFFKGIGVLKDYGLTYDILIRSSQMQEAAKLAALNPDQRFVLDHIGKPQIEGGNMLKWQSDIKAIARHENVYCKLSGLVTEAHHTKWKPADIFPYIDSAIEAFGVNRVMFGSDWPVCKLAAEYNEVCDLISNFLEPFSRFEKELIWSGNAIDFYNLDRH